LDLDSKYHIDLQKIQIDFETQSHVFHQQIELLTNSSKEKTRIIKQLEEENAYNLTRFQELKDEITSLRKEKNERVERLNQMIEEYEKKFAALESEFSLEKTNVEYQSDKQEEFLQKIKILEAQIVTDEISKEKLQSEWVEAHKSFEEKLKVIEKMKEEFIEVINNFFNRVLKDFIF